MRALQQTGWLPQMLNSKMLLEATLVMMAQEGSSSQAEDFSDVAIDDKGDDGRLQGHACSRRGSDAQLSVPAGARFLGACKMDF